MLDRPDPRDRRAGRRRSALDWRTLIVARGGRARPRCGSSTCPPTRRRTRSSTPSSSWSSARTRSCASSAGRTCPREAGSSAASAPRSARDGSLDWVALGFGCARGKVRMETKLAGPGADGRVTGAYATHGRQHLDFDTTQEHAAPHTTSDLAFRGILQGRSRGRLARHDQGRPGRPADRRLPGVAQPAAVARRRTPTRSRAWRSWPTTCAARTPRRSPRSTPSSSST